MKCLRSSLSLMILLLGSQQATSKLVRRLQTGKPVLRSSQSAMLTKTLSGVSTLSTPMFLNLSTSTFSSSTSAISTPGGSFAVAQSIGALNEPPASSGDVTSSPSSGLTSIVNTTVTSSQTSRPSLGPAALPELNQTLPITSTDISKTSSMSSTACLTTYPSDMVFETKTYSDWCESMSARMYASDYVMPFYTYANVDGACLMSYCMSSFDSAAAAYTGPASTLETWTMVSVDYSFYSNNEGEITSQDEFTTTLTETFWGVYCSM